MIDKSLGQSIREVISEGIVEVCNKKNKFLLFSLITVSDLLIEVFKKQYISPKTLEKFNKGITNE
jgi:hypothetical protein